MEPRNAVIVWYKTEDSTGGKLVDTVFADMHRTPEMALASITSTRCDETIHSIYLVSSEGSSVELTIKLVDGRLHFVVKDEESLVISNEEEGQGED